MPLLVRALQARLAFQRALLSVPPERSDFPSTPLPPVKPPSRSCARQRNGQPPRIWRKRRLGASSRFPALARRGELNSLTLCWSRQELVLTAAATLWRSSSAKPGRNKLRVNLRVFSPAICRRAPCPAAGSRGLTALLPLKTVSGSGTRGFFPLLSSPREGVTPPRAALSELRVPGAGGAEVRSAKSLERGQRRRGEQDLAGFPLPPLHLSRAGLGLRLPQLGAPHRSSLYFRYKPWQERLQNTPMSGGGGGGVPGRGATSIAIDSHGFFQKEILDYASATPAHARSR